MNDLRQHLIDVWAEVKQSVIDGASGADVTIRARGPDPYRAKDINKLEMVQRRAARFAKSDYCRTTSVSKLLDDLGWIRSEEGISAKHVWQSCCWQGIHLS